MKTQHTPGPWEVAEYAAWPQFRTSIHAPGYWLNLAEVYTISEGEQSEEGKANARLIAAAPRLLEALQKKFENELQAEEELWFRQNTPSGDHESVMRQWHESSDYNDFMDEWKEGLAAIAQATGKTL